MKIVFDNIIFSLQKRGGISVVWQELLSRFVASGADDLKFVEHPTDLNNAFRLKLDLPVENVTRINTRCLTIERYVNPRISNMVKPFVFHSSYFRTCSNLNAINVVTVHDFVYDYFYKGKRIGAFLHIWQRNKAIRKADAVVCISENTKRDLLKLLPDIDPEKVHVIYNAVSSDYYVIEDKIPALSECLLFVGGRHDYKNGRWFAECLRGTNYKVIFCGGPMNREERKYYDTTLGADRYEVIVGLTNEELNKYYNSVKCLVYPSSYEGFGIPILEAQNAGCPVIAYNTSSIPEVIGETPLLMQRLTREELLSKLTLLNDERLRREVVKNGLENAKRFSWDKSYMEYRKLYESLMDTRK